MSGEAALRRRVRGAYLAGSNLRLRSQRRAPVSAGATEPGQEHDATFEYDHYWWDGAVAGRRRGDYRRSLLDLRRTSSRAEPPACGTDRGDGQPERPQAEADQGVDRAAGLRVALFAGLLPRLQPHEEAFAKIKNLLRKAAARSKEALVEAIGAALSAVTAEDARGYFEHAGYHPAYQLL